MWHTFDYSYSMHPMFGWGPFSWFFPLIFILVPLLIALKGYVLWHAAKRDEMWWFIALLVLNTMGILELIYIIFVLKKFNARSEKDTYKKEDSPEPPKHGHLA